MLYLEFSRAPLLIYKVGVLLEQSVPRSNPDCKINTGDRRSRRETAVGETRKEMADRVARHQAD